MNRVILDTSAYSAFMRGHDGIAEAIQQAEKIYLNPVVMGELRAGFRKGRKEKKNLQGLEILLLSPRVEVVDIDETTAERYAVILVSLWDAGTPIPTNDVWISASAMQYGLRVLTTDPHYLQVVQVIVDYFEIP